MINIIICSTSPLRLYALMESLDVFWKDHPKPSAICKYDYNYNHIKGVNICYEHNDFGEVFESLRKPNCDHLILTDGVIFTSIVPDNLSLSNSDVIGHCLYMDEKDSVHTDVKYNISKHKKPIDWLCGVVVRESDIPTICYKTFDDFKDQLSYYLNNECPKKLLQFNPRSCCGRFTCYEQIMDDESIKELFPTKKIDVKPFYYTENRDGKLIGESTLVWRE